MKSVMVFSSLSVWLEYFEYMYATNIKKKIVEDEEE